MARSLLLIGTFVAMILLSANCEPPSPKVAAEYADPIWLLAAWNALVAGPSLLALFLMLPLVRHTTGRKPWYQLQPGDSAGLAMASALLLPGGLMWMVLGGTGRIPMAEALAYVQTQLPRVGPVAAILAALLALHLCSFLTPDDFQEYHVYAWLIPIGGSLLSSGLTLFDLGSVSSHAPSVFLDSTVRSAYVVTLFTTIGQMAALGLLSRAVTRAHERGSL